MVFCLPFSKLQKSLEMVSGTSDQAFRCQVLINAVVSMSRRNSRPKPTLRA